MSFLQETKWYIHGFGWRVWLTGLACGLSPGCHIKAWIFTCTLFRELVGLCTFLGFYLDLHIWLAAKNKKTWKSTKYIWCINCSKIFPQIRGWIIKQKLEQLSQKKAPNEIFQHCVTIVNKITIRNYMRQPLNYFLSNNLCILPTRPI